MKTAPRLRKETHSILETAPAPAQLILTFVTCKQLHLDIDLII